MSDNIAPNTLLTSQAYLPKKTKERLSVVNLFASGSHFVAQPRYGDGRTETVSRHSLRGVRVCSRLKHHPIITLNMKYDIVLLHVSILSAMTFGYLSVF